VSEEKYPVNQAIREMAEKVGDEMDFPVTKITVRANGKAEIKGSEEIVKDGYTEEKTYKQDIWWRNVATNGE
jgi:hypothetical protein